MDLLHTTVEIGLEEPFRVLHLTDSHICRAGAEDGERKMKLAKQRAAVFDEEGPGSAEKNLREQLAYADENDLPILYTGDFCDFVSGANLAYMREALFQRTCLMAAGNHEYSLYVGEAFEDEAYKMQSFARVQSFCGNDLRFTARVVGGVNFIALDNGYYLVNEKQLTQLRAEAAKGLPMVLMLHNPLYTPELAQLSMQVMNSPCAYLMGAPDALVDTYPENRARQQRADAATRRFMDYVLHEPLIRAVLAGHLHHHAQTQLPNGAMQYVTGGGFRGCAREVCFL